MKVLEIIPTLDRGGAEKQLCLLAAGLRHRGVDVHVCALTRGGPRAEALREADVPLHEIQKRWKFDPAAYARLKRLIGQLRPQLVHTWLFAANAYGRRAAFAQRVPAVVAGERCVDPWKTWELTIDRRLARRTDRIAVNSSGIREFYVDKGLPAEKFVVIPNAIDVPQPPAGERREQIRAHVREEFGLQTDDRVMLAVGRLWPQKRYKDLIWAMDLIKVVRDDVHLLIVGEGPQRWRLERYIDQARIEDRVHLLGERSDVPRLLTAADCYWLASGYEGQSNSLMEAMAAGLPVVASDIPGNRDLVVDGQSGRLVAVGDRAGYARAAHEILGDAELAARLGDAARQRMRSEFSLEKMLQRHLELYRELTSGDPASAGA